MSTKTLHKRIALVAVSALGFGLISTMPANAAAGDNIASYSAPTTYSINSAAATLGAAENIGTVTITQVPGITALQIDDDVQTLTLSANSKVAVTAASVTSDVATITAANHTFVAGDVVTIEGLTGTNATSLNGDQTIASVVALTSFTIAVNLPDGAATATGGDDFVTLKKDIDFLSNVSLSLTPTGSTTSAAAANLVTNSVVTFGTKTMVMTPQSASYTSASGSATLIAGVGLPATATGGKIKYTLSAAGGDTAIATFSSTLTLTFSPLIAGTRVTSPASPRIANIAAGGSATLTVTQPYTGIVTGTAIPGETFTLTPNQNSVLNSTFAVTGTATGGSASLVRTGANTFTSSLLKDTNTGAFSVTYTVVVTAPAGAVQGDTITVAAGSSTFTLTVFGGQTWNGTLTTLNRAAGTGFLAGNNQIYAASTASNVAVGSIVVNTGTGLVPALNPAWTFTMTGVGNMSVASGARSSYVAQAAGALSGATVELFADGRPGVGTLTITANGNLVATQVVNFYGAATQIKVTPVYTIARAGNGVTGYLTGDIDSATCTVDSVVNGVTGTQSTYSNNPAICADTTSASSNDPALVVQVLDALGTPIPARVGVAGEVLMSSSNTSAISSVSTSFLDAGVPTKTAGVLVNHVSYETTSTAKSGDKATLTFTHVNSLGVTITATQAVTVGGSKTGGTVTIATDKETYAPGERMKLTVTALDASGNKVYDNATSGSFSSNKNVPGLASGYYYDGQYILGDDAGEDLFAPSVTGSFDIILYTGTATGASVKITRTVSADGATQAANAATETAQAATDAAAEATDAANAATDAANAAAEAADAATAAAQDAADAVAALSAQVATMMAQLKAQLTALTNLVIKIQKKIKA
jgi:hypothetical protein